jgi:hypothetical protein
VSARPTRAVEPIGSLDANRLWTQREAAAYLSVTPRYLRESTCPKILLPGNGTKGYPVVRYDPTEVRAWSRAWHTDNRIERRAS